MDKPNNQLHLVDTCVIVNVRDIHGNNKVVWDALVAEIEADRLKSVRHVWTELESRFPDQHKRLKPWRKTLLIPDGDLYAPDVIAELREIQKHHAGLYNPLGVGNPADPFLIAAAKSKAAVVVTDEKTAGPKHQSKIPWVCKNRNVGCISGENYLKGLGCV